jgi:hypothetical protein
VGLVRGGGNVLGWVWEGLVVGGWCSVGPWGWCGVSCLTCWYGRTCFTVRLG